MERENDSSERTQARRCPAGGELLQTLGLARILRRVLLMSEEA
jgi:hypothetical protein